MYNSSKHVWPEFLPFGTLLVQTLVWVQWRVAVVFRYNSWYKTAQIWNDFFKHLIKHKHTGESWYSTSQWTFNSNCIGEKFQMCLGSQLYKCMNLHSSKKHMPTILFMICHYIHWIWYIDELESTTKHQTFTL